MKLRVWVRPARFVAAMMLATLPVAFSPGPLRSLAGAADPAPVRVAQPITAETAERLRLTGTVTAARRSRLSPRLAGLVSVVNVDAGDQVARGDVIVELDATIAKLELRAARAELDEARARLDEAERLREEARPLVEQQHLPETESRAREAQVQLAGATAERLRARVALWQEQVRRHQVRAPFAGVVHRKLTEAGEWVGTADPVVEIVDVEDLRIDVQVPQERFGDLRKDTPVRIRLDASRGVDFPGRVIALVPINDPAARTFLVRVEAPDAGGQMIPGASAEVELSIPGSKRALLVPRDALVLQPDGSQRVWVVETRHGETRAFSRDVRVGRALQETVEILDGLDRQLPVVVRGNEALREGQAVALGGGT